MGFTVTSLRRNMLSRMTALCAAAVAAATLAACASPAAEPGPDSGEEPRSVGSAAIFTPSDGLTISQRTPLNKWQALVPELTDALGEQGFEGDAVSTHTSDSLDRQSRDIQDFVVDSIADESVEAGDITLIVAPAVEQDDSTRQYGDYVSGEVAGGDAADDGSSGDGASDGEASEGGTDGDGTEETDEETQAVQRLVSALNLAKDSGMRVVLLSGTIQGFAPDAYVRMSDARRIGVIQAQNMVDKLNLDGTSPDNPKAIEILLPRDPSADDDADDDADEESGDAASDGSASDAEGSADEAADGSGAFAREAFAGIWEVLGPYFREGTAVSPSGLLDADTTQDDWRSVTFVADSDEAIADELTGRLGMEDSQTHTRIDGVIAMNDYVASAVTDRLAALGYTGTSADINPSITISGIVGNITGQVDLQKEAVPDPIKAPEEAGDETDETDIEQINSRWPIVTGYGAYLDVIPQIVNGQQWMTAFEDRKTLCQDIAQVCARLALGQSLDGLDCVTQDDVDGVQVPTVTEPLVAVSASNLKETLIDPGYITLADAGL